MPEELVWIGRYAYEEFAIIKPQKESRVVQDAEFWTEDIFFFVEPLTFVDTTDMVEG